MTSTESESCPYLSRVWLHKKKNADLRTCNFTGSLYRNEPTRAEGINEARHELSKLSRAWGYRAGKEGKHTEFEAGLKGDLYSALTPFTDPLMRTLAQGNVGWDKDFTDTFRELNDVKDTKLAKKIVQYISPFLRNKENLVKLCWLATQDLREPHSWLFGAWVLSARALLLFYLEDLEGVQQISNYWHDCIADWEKKERERPPSPLE